MDNKIKHLEFIQGVIDRMSSNLFLLKGWTITLIAALFALAAKDSKPEYALLAYVPIFVFWCLDGYFLGQERQFRDLYNTVRKLDESKIDFSMDTSEFGKKRDRKWYGAMMGGTLFGYYGPLVFVTFIVMIWVK
jgi:hypothetical protein